MRQRGLARPALPHDPEGLSGLEREGQAAQRVHATREANAQIAHLQQHGHTRLQRGFERGSRATPTNASPIADTVMASPTGNTHQVHAPVA